MIRVKELLFSHTFKYDSDGDRFSEERIYTIKIDYPITNFVKCCYGIFCIKNISFIRGILKLFKCIVDI